MMKNDTELHIIKIFYSDILELQYGINSASVISTDNPCYRSVLEQYTLGWFNFVGRVM